MKCTLCNNLLTVNLDDDYFVCQCCHAIIKNKALYPDFEEEKKRYLQHNNDVNDHRYQEFTSPVTNYILDAYTPDHKGLDFGSGTGPVISKMLTDKGFDIKQYDPFFAKEPELLNDKYDYVVACEVVEHFYNPDKEFRLLRSILKPHGQLVCLTLLYYPEIDFKNWRYRKDPTHVIIYQVKTIEYITKHYGFNSFDISNGRRVIWQ